MRSEVLLLQYNLIREAREVLFKYCGTISPAHFTEDIETFGGRSIRYLLVHTCNTYRFWMGHFTGLDNADFVGSNTVSNLGDVQNLYEEVNILVNNFLKQVNSTLDEPITGKVPKRELSLTLTPLQLFTHVITHEYHHKGQLLSMSRHLGYLPVDTDLIRF